MKGTNSTFSNEGKSNLSNLLSNPNPRSTTSKRTSRHNNTMKPKSNSKRIHLVPVLFMILLLSGLLSIAHYHLSTRGFASRIASSSSSSSSTTLSSFTESYPKKAKASAPQTIKDIIESVHDGHDHVLEQHEGVKGLNLRSHAERNGNVGLAAAGKLFAVEEENDDDDDDDDDVEEEQTTHKRSKLSKATKSAPHSSISSFPNSKGTIAYAISITACTQDDEASSRLLDGAAVLKHSIHMNSINNHNPPPTEKSQFSYDMIAFVHPDASACIPHLRQLGYIVNEKESPIKVEEIKSEWYRDHVVKSGCCQEKEFLKLYAYTLTSYPIVVHLDVDALILKPLDDLFLVMLNSQSELDAVSKELTKQKEYDGAKLENVPVMHNKPLPSTINAMFTRDYNMVRPGKEHVGVQGGFLILRPSLEAFEQYRQIILEGNFQPGKGWDGKYGGFYGAQQIQGIVAYFYDHFHPNTSVELNRCVYNSMADKPRNPEKDGGKCRDGRDFCEDCRGTNLDHVRSIHFTLCQKPWLCLFMEETGEDIVGRKKCNEFHKEWHKVRNDLEDFLQVDKLSHDGEYRPENFYGHCKHGGQRGYIPLFEMHSSTALGEQTK